MEELILIRKEYDKIMSDIDDLKAKAGRLSLKLKSLSPLSFGDKVIYRDRVYFIFHIGLSYSVNCPLVCDLTSPKKDGTMPGIMRNGVYHVSICDLKKAD